MGMTGAGLRPRRGIFAAALGAGTQGGTRCPANCHQVTVDRSRREVDADRRARLLQIRENFFAEIPRAGIPSRAPMQRGARRTRGRSPDVPGERPPS